MTLLAAAAAAALLMPAVAVPVARADDISGRQQQIEAAITAASADEDDASAAITAAATALRSAQAQLGAAQTQLRTDRSELALARTLASQASRAAMTAQAQLARADQQLVDAAQAVAVQQQDIDGYAVAAYETGAAPSTLVVVAAGQTAGDLVRRVSLLDLAARGQAEVLAALGAARQQLAQARDLVAARTAAAGERRQMALSAAARVAAVTAAQQAVTDRLAGLTRTRDAALVQAQAALSADRSRVGQLQVEAVAIEALLRARSSSVPAGTTLGPEHLIWPVDGPITSPFGYRLDPVTHQYALHAGIDIGAPLGTPIKAAKAGTVVFAGQETGYGNYTCIDHGGGFSTCYAHQSRELVTVGQRVAQGQVIGLVGDTGYTTGPHLHFETRVDGVPENPMLFL